MFFSSHCLARACLWDPVKITWGSVMRGVRVSSLRAAPELLLQAIKTTAHFIPLRTVIKKRKTAAPQHTKSARTTHAHITNTSFAPSRWRRCHGGWTYYCLLRGARSYQFCHLARVAMSRGTWPPTCMWQCHVQSWCRKWMPRVSRCSCCFGEGSLSSLLQGLSTSERKSA